MKKNSIRNFLCRLKNLTLKKHFFLKVEYNKINRFLASTLTKEGFFRGFFLVEEEKSDEVKIYIILKYDEMEKASFRLVKNKNILLDKAQFTNHKKLVKYCNGLGLSLVYSIKGFISNEVAFWLKLGGKSVIEMK